MYSRDSAFLQNSSSRSQSSIVQNLLDSFHNEYMDSEPNPKPVSFSTFIINILYISNIILIL